ncbi:MAG: hypothetical protein A2268_16705 [Candidatus Raymondbacteria bacterium RifOxyA12_full_50_37]|uniref:Uncharacterized protein n=1 Tax=Candidatus Raymondbacteria bacterium RIFOXYD12_FULL_49_13 TaxID=1817890 RepID=A0A1F7F489_UNCRA|nr:MAG: hypothetical protein A2268_16705 [Candidatus Raymondbacteria bacterium RifOxyA12_full_50_37]OGJ86251.1 MAG: hypothetical protein A2248_16295 [Candidatus Raymondbacteria bacterium RIFOXYA2_FULL_49_16]OGJ95789.1 MAG: hypothetical protein A2453_11615 [Candidatus Raymondbacteria bacterium RIFOXYC2_FULL_50_21]OGJ96462.1 MAG: hypothetical protein A2350_05025 [Candidatus Raymondbacteria bacterium RifOxyB12_full_50_8]OGK01451.1 MAG: hypothetical protein A2519_19185 [Candidatus Raymondbacteria b
MLKNNLFYEQKKGDPSSLKGVVIVYAVINNPETEDNRKSPIYEMAKTGIIAAMGDYRTQKSLEDFLKKELGISLDDLGKSENAAIAGIPPNANPDFIRKKLESLKDYEELIPTPARLEVFDAEHELLSRDADIFYLGRFDRLANANLAINAFPILYQALYREQVALLIAQEIDKMLSAATQEVSESGHYLEHPDTVEHKLNAEFLPELIYSHADQGELDGWVKRFRSFMAGYKYPGEVEKIIALASGADPTQKDVRSLLELYIKRIGAFLREDYKLVGELKDKITRAEQTFGNKT